MFFGYKEPNGETHTKCWEVKNCEFKPTPHHIKCHRNLLPYELYLQETRQVILLK